MRLRTSALRPDLRAPPRVRSEIVARHGTSAKGQVQRWGPLTAVLRVLAHSGAVLGDGNGGGHGEEEREANGLEHCVLWGQVRWNVWGTHVRATGRIFEWLCGLPAT